MTICFIITKYNNKNNNVRMESNLKKIKIENLCRFKQKMAFTVQNICNNKY